MFGYFKKKNSTNENEHSIVSLSADDAVLQACQKKAQEELHYLIDFMRRNEKNEDLFRYAVKANFIGDEDSEHMWVQVTEFKDDCFIGRLANEPATVKLIKYGDFVKVLRRNVEDWILEDFVTNTNVGGFSRNYIKNKKKQVE